MEEENKGLTLKSVFTTIWLKKWVALIVAIAVTLVMAISLYYGYNPAAKTYSVEFSLNLPGDDGRAFYSYPDGKKFYYADMISEETLKEIKQNGDFSDVSVDEMVKRSDIGITRDVTVTPLTSEGSSVYKETVYSVSVKAKYFNGKNEAKKFLISIAKYPAKHLENMEINYDIYLPLAKEAADANNDEVAVKYLNEQLNFISKEYDKLIEIYGGTFVVSNGKTLLACKQEVGYTYEDSESLNVDAAYASVDALTSSFRATSKTVYEKATTVSFIQPSIIVENGGMELTRTLLLSVIVGVLVAFVAAYVAGYLDLKKKKAVSEAPSDTVYEEQTVAETKASGKKNKK